MYQKLPTGGQVQSYTTQQSNLVTPAMMSKEQQYNNLAAQIEAGKSLRMAMNAAAAQQQQ